MLLQRSPSLVEQVKTYLKQRISNAEFEDGRIPSELDLAGELKVSRNTVRDALSRLEMEGVIYRRQGAGTFVNNAHRLVKTRLEAIVPYKTLIQEHGYRPAITLISAQEQAVAPEVTEPFNLPPDQKMLVIQKLFLADDQPVIFTQTSIPTSLIAQPYTNPDLRLPPYRFLPKICQQPLAYFLTDIVPLIAPPDLANRLALPQPQTALLSFEEMGYNQDNEPVIKAISYFRDDLLRLRLIRRQAS